MKKIHLGSTKAKKHTKYFALVDDDDYDELMKYTWSAKVSPFNVYAVRTIQLEDGKQHVIKMHRQILNAPLELVVDHINHNGLDNRRENIRLCTKYQNHLNPRKRKDASSKYMGVVYSEEMNGPRKDNLYKYFKCLIKVNGKQLHLKKMKATPENEITCAKIYDEAAKKYHGEFANLNFR